MAAVRPRPPARAMAELEHLGGKRAESARVRRAEQLRRWRGSQTEQEPAERQPRTRRGAPRVRFEDGAVFLAACSSGDTDEVKRLLARGADINTANVDGLTALHQVTRGARGAGPRPPTASPPARLCPPAGARTSRVPAGPGFGFPSTSSGCHGYWGLGPGVVAIDASLRAHRALARPVGSLPGDSACRCAVATSLCRGRTQVPGRGTSRAAGLWRFRNGPSAAAAAP